MSKQYDAFICHASEDKESVAQPLAEKLSGQVVRVFYDEFSLRVGDSLRRSIDTGLRQSKFGITILSPAFFRKEWPQKELDGLVAKERAGVKVILPIWHKLTVEDIAKYSPTLADRIGLLTSRGMDYIVGELLKVVGESGEYGTKEDEERGRVISLGKGAIERKPIPVAGGSLALPCFFPSISSIKTHLSPYEYLRVLLGLDHKLLLISAYDIFNAKSSDRDKIKGKLKEARRSGTVILLDSGYYESSWKDDKTWNVKSFRQMLESLSFDLAFCFDKNLDTKTKKKKLTINRTEAEVLKDQEYSLEGTIVPIIHSDLDEFPNVCAEVARRLNPVLMAVPERELGDGLIARAVNIAKIRKVLNATGNYYSLHILGTGNPRSIALYSYCGADSFDGLEWCQTAVDHNTSLLYHFHQRELFGLQTSFCEMTDIPYVQATLGHNLLFYTNWMRTIQMKCIAGQLQDFVQGLLPDSFIKLLDAKLSEV